MKKKLLTMFLAGAMILSCFAGCGKAEEKQTEESNKTSVSEQSSAEEESKQEEPEEIVTVKWHFPVDKPEDMEQVLEEVNKLLRERYSLELDFICVSSGEYDNRMQLMSASNEDHDLVFTSSWLNLFTTNVQRESLLPLDDLLKSEAGQLLASALPEGHTNVAAVNGITYAVPNYQLQYSQRGYFVQKDLAEKYNLDVDSVKNITDLEPFMEQIRDNEEGIWPLCIASGFPDYLNCGFCEKFQDVALVANDDLNFTVKFVFEDERFDENLRLVNDYFKRGFIRSDQASITDETADLQANRYAIRVGNAVPGSEAQISASAGEEYILIKGSEPYKGRNAGGDTMTAINVNSKNPEAAIKMLGVMWTDKEIYNMLVFGLEGEHYKKVGENRIEPIADSGYDLSGMAWALGNQFNAYLIPGQADDVWEVTIKNNQEAPVSPLAGFQPDTTMLKTEAANISSVKSEYFKSSIWAEDYEAWKKEYTDKLKAAGADTVIKEMQKQIDAWRVENNK
uniref:ABC transporter substrate-binding protein n=1 Tax=Agathobacter sp. TaxID=2021311 RepID=UPI004056CF91